MNVNSSEAESLPLQHFTAHHAVTITASNKAKHVGPVLALAKNDGKAAALNNPDHISRLRD